MKKLLGALLALALVSAPAGAAVKTYAQIVAEIQAAVRANGSGAITGTTLNGILLDIADSYTIAGSVLANPMTATGDLIAGGVAGAPTRLPVGAATQVLLGGSSPTWGTVNVATMVTGVLAPANGGTGLSTFSRRGNTTVFATVDGTPLAGNCAQWDSNGNLVDALTTCGGGGGGGGSGTVASGHTGELAYYSADGTTVSGNTNLIVTDAVLALGATGHQGGVGLAGGTSGLVSIKPQAAAGTYNFNLPQGPGTSGQLFVSGGGVSNPTNWVSLTESSRAAFRDSTLTATPRVFDGSSWIWSGSDQSANIMGSGVTSTSVNDATETITKTAHGFVTGNAVMVTAAVDGLAANTKYYIIRVTVDTFRLASSFANAQAGSAFNLTGTINMTLQRHYDPMEGIYVPPSADLTGASGAWIRQIAGKSYHLAYFQADPTGTNFSDEAIAGARDLFEKQVIAQNLVAAELNGEGGNYRTQYSINFTNLRGRGYAINNMRVICEAAGKICLDFTGSNYSSIDQIFVLGSGTSIPHSGIVYGRIDDGGGVPYPIAEQNEIGTVNVYGTFTCAGFINIASEVMHGNSLTVQNQYWQAGSSAVLMLGSTSGNYCAAGLPVSDYQTIGLGDGQSLSAVKFDRLNARKSPAYGYAISSISNTNPAVVTISAADCAAGAASFGLASGTGVFLDAIAGGSWPTNVGFKAFSTANVNCAAGTMELVGVDGTALGAFSSGILRNNTGPAVALVDVKQYEEGGGYHVAYSDHHYRIDPRWTPDGNWNIKLISRPEVASDYIIKFIGNGVANTVRNLEVDIDNVAARIALMQCPACSGASGKVTLVNPRFNLGHNAQTPTIGLIQDTARIKIQGGDVRVGYSVWGGTPTALSGSCTLGGAAPSTCGAQTFPNGFTFSAAPTCIVTYGSGTSTNELKATSTTSTVTPSTTAGSGTETVNWACFGT